MDLVKRLAYVQLEVSDVPAWVRFARDVLACEIVPVEGSDTVRLRIDDRPWRIEITSGPRNDIVALGLEVDCVGSLDRIRGRLAAADHPFRVGDPQACEARGVHDLLYVDDPSGLNVELSCASLLRPQQPFHPPLAHGGFVTGKQGLGHVMLIAENVEEVHRFYCAMLGFVTSDYVSTNNYGGRKADFIFIRCNERHHSLAMGFLPIGRRLAHLMLEVNKLDDVGHALDRVKALGYRQTRALGKHINDHMLSFYVESPSKNQIEYGWGGLEIDESSLETRMYDVTSVWGHQHLTVKE